jgi:hypothetical protein
MINAGNEVAMFFADMHSGRPIERSEKHNLVNEHASGQNQCVVELRQVMRGAMQLITGAILVLAGAALFAAGAVVQARSLPWIETQTSTSSD